MKRGDVFVAPSTVQGEGPVRILRYSCSHLPNIFKKKKKKLIWNVPLDIDNIMINMKIVLLYYVKIQIWCKKVS